MKQRSTSLLAGQSNVMEKRGKFILTGFLGGGGGGRKESRRG